MTTEQLIVLGLLVAAFAAGWVARGPDGGRAAPGDEEAPPVPEPEAPAPAEAVQEARDAVAALVDGWIDGEDPGPRVAAVGAARDRLRGPAGGGAPRQALDAVEAVLALASAYEQGRPLDAATSAALAPHEDALDAAASGP